jgi:hypothetical protein
MRKVGLGVAFVLGSILAINPLLAQASKFTATMDSVEILASCAVAGSIEGGACGEMETTTRVANIKTPGSKTDLLIGVSIETGIVTDTVVKGKNGGGGTAQASGEIRVSLEIDSGAVDVYPPAVTFDARTQRLSAVLGGVIEECTCTVVDGVCTIDVSEDCTVTPEEIGLLLDTVGAHHFNFVALNVGPGDHTIDVTVDIVAAGETTADALLDDATTLNTTNATAVKGPMNITVEAVKSCNQEGCVAIIEE